MPPGYNYRGIPHDDGQINFCNNNLRLLYAVRPAILPQIYLANVNSCLIDTLRISSYLNPKRSRANC